MATLKEQVTSEPTRSTVVKDCVELLDNEVSSRRGVSGFAVKSAYKTVKAIKPGFVTGVVDALLDDWIAKLEAMFADFQSGDKSGTFGEHIAERREEVAELLLEVTDERAERTKHTTAKKLYHRLRGGAKTQVSSSVPALGQVMDKHVRS